jgi:hypothetical protein
MLAAIVLPPPVDVTQLFDVLGTRHALDYVGLPDTLTDRTNWFRTLILPDRTVEFECFDVGEHFAEFFHGSGTTDAWLGRLREASGPSGPDWRGLAVELLPPSLLSQLRAGSDTEPIELLISAHLSLSMLPWAALKVDDAGTRLVTRAVITQTPVLTCLADRDLPAVTGPALVHLVPDPELEVEFECRAWELAVFRDRATLAAGTVGTPVATPEIGESLEATLTPRPTGWRFLHVAAHGDGLGLAQYLDVPPRPLLAGHALWLSWPESVLMASCHVGRLVNIAETEPLSLVMALLTGGSRCVVAAMDEIADISTGRLAADLVAQVRANPTRLDVALRKAQLDLVTRQEYLWALFSAYVR